MSTPVGPPDPTPAEDHGAEAALDPLLRQIITGFFVLTDGQGALSKWSEPAELLFGLSPDDALGQPFFGKIVSGPLPPEGNAWRAFLESGEAPGVKARVELQASHPKIEPFGIETVFIPVKLDEGFDFSLFLEDLAFELPIDLMILRMRQQHPVVIRALRAALSQQVPSWEGWRTAGTLIAFRPVGETPWLEEALREREAAAAEVEAEVQSRIQAYEAPEVKGSDVLDLEDARAVVDRLKWATERIEELEGKASQMESAASQAAEARDRAEAAEAAAVELSAIMQRPDFSAASPEAEAARLELLTRVERLERSIAEAVDSAAAARLAAEQERASARSGVRTRADLEARLEALEKAGTPEGGPASLSEGDLTTLRSELADVREEALEASALAHMASAVRHDVEVLKLRGDEAIALREEIARLRERSEQMETDAAAREERDRALQRDAEAARAELRAAMERVEALSEQAGRLRAQVGTAGAGGSAELSPEDRRRLQDAVREAEEARAGLEAMRATNEELLVQSAELREEAGALQAQVAELREGDGHARHDLGDIRRQQDEVRTWLEEARRERDEAKAQVLEAVAHVEEARAAMQTAATRPPSGVSNVAGDSGVRRGLKRARQDVESVRRDTEAVRARLEKLGADTEAAAHRADEARTEAAALRAENDQTREEARAAQAASREVAARVDKVDRGAANVLAEVKAQKALVEEIGTIARSAHEDAAASRAEAGEARAAAARIEEGIAATREQVEQVLGEVAGAREQAAAASEAADAARELAADAGEQAIAAAAKMADELADRMRSDSKIGEGALRKSFEGLADRIAALEARPEPDPDATPGVEPEVIEGMTGRIDALAAELAATSIRLAELPEPAAGVGEERLAEMAAELMAARTETDQARKGVDELRDELKSLREYAAGARTEATSALETASAARAAGSTGDRAVDDLRKEVAALLAMIQEFKAGFEESRQAAVAARRDAEQARLAAESVGSQNQETTERFTEVWREILNLGPAAAAPGVGGVGSPRSDSGTLLAPRRGPAPALPKKEVPVREPRSGFDDVKSPMAILGLDGRFTELNPAFARLVGYTEHEFAKAVWPSAHDRQVYEEQYAQLEQLATGALEKVAIQSTYMHGQGLMVPIVGEITVVRDDSGEPAHLLLVAEDRQTS